VAENKMGRIGLLGDIFGIDPGEKPLIRGDKPHFSVIVDAGEPKTAHGLIDVGMGEGAGGDVKKAFREFSVKSHGLRRKREFHVVPVTVGQRGRDKAFRKAAQKFTGQKSLDLMLPCKTQMLQVTSSALGKKRAFRCDAAGRGRAEKRLCPVIIFSFFSEPGAVSLFPDIGIKAEKITSCASPACKKTFGGQTGDHSRVVSFHDLILP